MINKCIPTETRGVGFRKLLTDLVETVEDGDWLPEADGYPTRLAIHANSAALREARSALAETGEGELIRALRAIESYPRHSREDDAENVVAMQDIARAALAALPTTF